MKLICLCNSFVSSDCFGEILKTRHRSCPFCRKPFKESLEFQHLIPKYQTEEEKEQERYDFMFEVTGSPPDWVEIDPYAMEIEVEDEIGDILQENPDLVDLMIDGEKNQPRVNKEADQDSLRAEKDGDIFPVQPLKESERIHQNISEEDKIDQLLKTNPDFLLLMMDEKHNPAISSLSCQGRPKLHHQEENIDLIIATNPDLLMLMIDHNAQLSQYDKFKSRR